MTLSDPVSSGAIDLQVHDLGRMSYAEAFELQRQLQAEVIAARESDDESAPRRMHLLLVEHDPPVITVSRRKTARQHLIASDAQLRAAGVEVAETDRGGDITYHGPGQLVAYPILDLNVLGLRLHSYMRLLEQIVIDVLRAYGIEGSRDASATGVWVDEEQARRHEGTEARSDNDSALSTQDSALGSRKICAMGVRFARWVSMHGLALNVTTDLRHFQLIVPCGLAGRGVTSMQQLLGGACPTMEDVKRAMVARFRSALYV